MKAILRTLFIVPTGMIGALLLLPVDFAIVAWRWLHPRLTRWRYRLPWWLFRCTNPTDWQMTLYPPGKGTRS